VSVDLPSIRAGIATLLGGIPSIKTVLPYDRADAGTNQLPCASILLVKVTQPGYDGGGGQLGSFEYDAEWHINVRLANPQPQVEILSQQLFETIFSAIRSQFDNDQLLDPNGPGVVDVSSITSGDLLVPADSQQPFIAGFVLNTRVFA
jgi:hypothetical protein